MRRLIWPALLAVLASGCGTTPGARISPFPKPGSPAAKQPAIDPDLPQLPAAGSGRGGYYKDDGPGDNPPPNLKDVADAEVRAEPYSKYANRPYKVFGKTYTPIVNDEPFTQRGVSSWYGKKFHGQRTSSGELYDMYKMTAAHPTLPIPSFARVTSVASGKQVVVRINDRGPFHASRIIDVSFTAALKLGLLGKGSHEVEVERLLPGRPEKIATARRNAPPASPESGALTLENQVASDAGESAPKPAPAGGFYLQLGAYKLADKAAQVRARLEQYIGAPAAIEVIESGALHRLFGGPFASRAEAAEAARRLPAALRLKPIMVRR